MKKQNSYWEKKSIWNFSGFLKAKFLRICPYGTAYLNKLVTQCMREVLVCSLFVLLLLWIWNRIWKNSSWGYLLESVLLAVYLTAMEVPNYKIQEKENKVYQELLIFFSRVKHRYMACRHIANAVLMQRRV
ncbi:MAG: hypothetical protein IJ274_12025 [Lachnospiraceae bacterium]|nr:hypothetical protein [Lachnospiraceae bacterium]